MFEVTLDWTDAFPHAHAGVLVVRDVSNPARHPELEKRKTELEEHLRAQFSGQDRAALVSRLKQSGQVELAKQVGTALARDTAAGQRLPDRRRGCRAGWRRPHWRVVRRVQVAEHSGQVNDSPRLLREPKLEVPAAISD